MNVYEAGSTAVSKRASAESVAVVNDNVDADKDEEVFWDKDKEEI